MEEVKKEPKIIKIETITITHEIYDNDISSVDIVCTPELDTRTVIGILDYALYKIKENFYTPIVK